MPLRRIAIAAASLVAGPLLLAGAAGAATTLKSITSLPTATPNGKSFVVNWVEPIKADKSAPVAINFLGGPEVQPANKAHTALQRGVVDLLHGPSGYYAGQVPEAFMMTGSNLPVAELWKNGALDRLQPIYGSKLNAHILAWGESNVPFNIWTQFAPAVVAKGPDLAGKKIRSSPTYRGMLVALDATPVSMPPGDIYTALQRGVIDGFVWPAAGVPGLGLADIVKYRVEPGFYRSNTVIIVNLDSWKKLTKSERDYLEAVSRRYETASDAMMAQVIAEEMRTLEGKGMKVVRLDGKARTAFLKTAYDALWQRLDDMTKGASAPLRAKFYQEGR